MFFTRIFTILGTLFLILLFCCGPAAELVPVYVETVEIIGGYSLGKPALGDLKFYGISYPCYDNSTEICYPTIADESIAKIGWDESYIIVKRFPREPILFSKPDTVNPTWFIVVLSTNTVYKDLTQEEFKALVKSLNIPPLEIQDAVKVYKQGKYQR